MINALKKLGIEGTYLNIIKKIYIQNYPKWRKAETTSCKVRNETRVSTLSILNQ
jgi:hypothetical protein